MDSVERDVEILQSALVAYDGGDVWLHAGDLVPQPLVNELVAHGDPFADELSVGSHVLVSAEGFGGLLENGGPVGLVENDSVERARADHPNAVGYADEDRGLASAEPAFRYRYDSEIGAHVSCNARDSDGVRGLADVERLHLVR